MRTLLFIGVISLFILSCHTPQNQEDKTSTDTSMHTMTTDTVPLVLEAKELVDTAKKIVSSTTETIKKTPKQELSVVYVYNFHLTNRCPSCVAIENATSKTLKMKFKNEVASGRVIQKIINVDDEKNTKIAEKYQAFGSGLMVARVFKGKETITDMTGDGFKYARNKEDIFIEKLATTITQCLN